MLKHRLIFGPILIVAFLGIVVLNEWIDRDLVLSEWWRDALGGRERLPRGLLLFVVSLVIAPLGALEISNVYRANGILTRSWLTALAAVAGLVLSYAIPADLPTPTALAILSTGMIAVFCLALITLTHGRNVEGVVAGSAAVVLAMVYIGLLLGFYLAIVRWHSAWWIVGIVMTTKMCDSGAYFTGRAIGKHKLIPWLSPGKTWEGLWGGVVTATLFGGLFAWLSALLPEARDHVPLWLGLVCGAVFGVVGQLGDLAMSLFKRDAGLKDSSTIIPGLGGVMDVLDSPLLVAPVAYWMLAGGGA